MIALQDQAMLQDVSGPIGHAPARVSPTVQLKRTGQTSLLTQTEKLLTPETQDHLNLEAMKQEDLASLQGLLIVALVPDQDLDTVQIHLSAQLAMIAASAPIVQQGISPVILSVALRETLQENLEELMSHVQTRESMTATVTRTAKTESQETSLVTPALLALATRTQTAKHSLRTRF
jgi:hypothetical protein